MGNVVSIQPPPIQEFTPQQLDLIRRTVAADCNTDEFNLFITVARHVRLDPFRKQIMALVFSKDDAKKRRMSIVTGIDGLRSIAARTGRYRPDEEEPAYAYDEAEKGPHNPLGIVKCNTRIWIADAMRDGGWKPVAGVAYWDEFAPIKEDASEGYDWIETGDIWPDSGRPKMKKMARPGSKIIRMLDTSGQWGRMGRHMIAKCSESVALRKAFPEDLSGLYEHAELDRARAEMLPSEIVGEYQEAERLTRIGVAGGIMFQMFPNSPLEAIPVGQIFDRVVETVRSFTLLDQIRWFTSANQQPLREFWARSQADALELKKIIEDVTAKLEAPAAP